MQSDKFSVKFVSFCLDNVVLDFPWEQNFAVMKIHCVIVQGVSKNCSTFDKILKNKDNVNKLMER